MAADKRVPHHPLELAYLLKLASQSKSLLEIGSRYGDVLRLMSRQMKSGRVVAVDLPNVFPWGEDSEADLKANVEDMRKDGFDVHLFLSDSTDPETVADVHDLGPFDLVFIDGDHRYEGVKLDWLNYGPLGKTVVFHDIVQPKAGERQELGVWKLWQEIQSGNTVPNKFLPVIGENSKMGLGVVDQSLP